ncbi:PLP-dependent aminotransferase family protein [uncultured Helicobacter sp.]|uniref:aminotransferase-like domain-containing protein n=1 Tax=uncultured Helicobacter sp. TaxID=175537 RepID=UPI00258B8613|nr:PLP-dependent aminotransferase family protein [uncultured Helicobacter sp.]
MDYHHFYSHIAKSARPSPVREILKVLDKENMISFAGGMPDPNVFPIEEFAQGSEVLKTKGAQILQYSITEGNPQLREFIASWSAPRMGGAVSNDQIMITSGSQQIIDLLCWSIIDPQDIVITEDPTYLAALNVFSNHQVQIQTVDTDKHGIKIDDLESTLQTLKKNGKSPKLLYSIVNFQNPSGIVISEERRQKIAKLADEYDFLILEDDPYGYLRYEGEHLHSIYSYNNNRVIYAGSFSKILSPAVRIGWAIGAKEIIRQMIIFKQSVDIYPSAITQELVLEYCKKGYLESHLPKILALYKAKRDVMQQSFESDLAPLKVKWNTPKGGFFFWLDLEDTHINADTLTQKALQNNLAVIPAKPFCVNQNNSVRFIRCNFSYPSTEIIQEGSRRIAQSIQELLC